ncbi:MAG: NAD-dependent epimerase/dehydratase family protein [Sedimentisphaerales bacterium]|jgi:GDP-4-dehydro-6-deoxy-D-mannose reductase
MRKRVLVTGACGFAGRYMCEYLCDLKDRPEVIGTDIIASESKTCDAFYKTDLASGIDTADLIKQAQPDYIIHLAGTFGTNDSQEIYRVNVLSATALLEAVRIHKSDTVVIMAGSAAEYGKVDAEQLPVMENTPCQPVTAYGLSKLLATQVALYYHRVHSLNVMIVRPFQLIGKGVTARLAPGAFAEQLKRAISDESNVIKVGNLESSRDFLDIRDAVEAIWTLCQKPAAGEIFNICSGKPIKMADLLKMMVTCAGVDIKIGVDPERLRGTSDINTIFGSCEKLQHYCGWKPQTSLEISIRKIFK